MTESRIDAGQAREAESRSEVPDVWFSSPPDEEALKETPRPSGLQIVFTSAPRESR